jgi:formylglycine-generating enzyme required for sulfatase activity
VDVLDDLNQSIKVITRDMLPWDVLQDLNGTITRSRLSADILADLNATGQIVNITRDMLPWDVLEDLNGTITRSRLSVDVLADLNQSIKVITRDMLPWDVLEDLNGTITRSRLSVDVLDDLNQSIKVITRDMLPWDVLQDLNGTITRSRLSADVLADLNQTIVADSITLDKLSPQVRADLNGTITRSRLSVDVLDDLNQSIKVITRDMLPWDVLEDLNGTISRSRLSVDVLDDLNQSIKVITRDMLPWDVLEDLNGTITRSRLSADILDDLNQSIKAITRDMLPWDVLQDLNGTISRSRLSVDILDDLNQSIKAITRDMLPWDVLEDLNGTIPRSRLAPEVLADLNQSIKAITRDMLPWDVLEDLNGTIPRSRLAPEVLADLNRTILRSDLPASVLDDLNRTVTATNIAANTITKSMLEETILKYLKPEITQSPQAPAQVYTGQTLTLLSHAEGKYLTYQWKRDGVDLTGETNATLTITEANNTLHYGNYLVVVSNDFGSVSSEHVLIEVNLESEPEPEPEPEDEPEDDGMADNRVVTGASNLEMLWVEPGTFTMGSPTSEEGRNVQSEDEHSVTLTKGFYLGKYEVTQAQYKAVMTGNSGLSSTPSQFSGDDRPVEKVSWDDVQVFLTRLNAAEQAAGRLPAGWSYVLPTESEWEYACRAGTTTAYSWGNDINSSNANYDQSGIDQTRDVGQYAANPWGFFDMHGNVWEWTADWYAESYPTGSVTDPVGPPTGSGRVDRGGSWGGSADFARSADRYGNEPADSINQRGFRLCLRKVNVEEDGMADNRVVTGASNLEMLWVEPGTFTMGSPASEAGRNVQREDEHSVTLTKGFYLGKYEVTQAQYEAVMTGNSGVSATPSNWPNKPNRPVEKVSWNEVQVFLSRLNAAEQAAGRLPAGSEYVLPTESEWEYACRAGTTTTYSWGNDINSSNANYNQSGIGQTRDVGQYAANPWGFFDMHGNVFEWTADWYAASYPTGSVTDPVGPATGSFRVRRGGSFYITAYDARSAFRSSKEPAYSVDSLGFRLCLRLASQ